MLREDPHLVFISQREDQFFFYYCYMYFKTNGIVSAFTYFHKRPFPPRHYSISRCSFPW